MVKNYIGGQALIEGVLMKNKNKVAVAVRNNKGKITVKKEKIKFKENKIPFIRGIVNLFVILYIGIKYLNYSANESLGKEEKIGFWSVFFSFLFAIVFAIAIFKFLPLFLTTIFDKFIKINNITFNIIEGILKLGIFVLYVYIISFMKDVHRVFQYHGAEHKAVACYEAGKKLNIKEVQKFRTEHKRCGTSFIFLVLFLSIIVYSFVPKDMYFWTKLILRIALLPVIAGISYEFLRLSARYNIFTFLVYPGLWIQKITTKQPDNKQVEVAIKALKGALD